MNDKEMNDKELIRPDWPAPRNVRACTTTRSGGVSKPPYESFNLGDHVHDDAAAVMRNRELLMQRLGLMRQPVWLQQVHGLRVIDAAQPNAPREADAAYSFMPELACAVLTADCLPVLLCDRAGTRVAAAHAGWRGLAGGVLEAAVAALGTSGEDLLAWLGPAIGPKAFEVGDEVRAAFTARDAGAVEAFRPLSPGKWLADLYLLARRRLMQAGVLNVYGGHWCTYADSARFYSYRRDRVTGRMATLIWMDAVTR